MIIFGKKEREYFEMHGNNFSQYIHDYYNNSKTFHDGKWMYIDVSTLEQLEEIKKMEPHLIKMWGITDWSMRCEGCYSDHCYCKDEPCNEITWGILPYVPKQYEDA